MSLHRELSGIETSLLMLRKELRELGDRIADTHQPRSHMVRGMCHHAATRLDAVQRLLVEIAEFAPDEMRLDS